jgi:hypothetical protein
MLALKLRRLAAASIAILAPLLVLPAVASAVTANDTSQFSVTAGSLTFVTAPDVPDFNTPGTPFTIVGYSQTYNATMNNFEVNDARGSGAGWSVTVQGQTGAGNSPVFAQYCPNATCGTDTGPGYVSSGATLPNDSLTLNSTGASFTAQGGTTSTAPTFACNSSCFVDHSGAVTVASAASGNGMGEWLTSGFTSTSLTLTIPAAVKTLQTNEVYRVNLLWTLS